MMAIVIDDFDIILDNKFLKRGVLVMHEEKPCFVESHIVFGTRKQLLLASSNGRYCTTILFNVKQCSILHSSDW